MRVFILCTGRSASTTIIKACSHIENYSAGHETRVQNLGDDRYAYPEDHIEADNRLSWLLGSLHKHFGDEAYYVHIKRDRDKVANSFLKRFDIPGSIIDAYLENIKMTRSKISQRDRLQICYDYVDTVNENIEYFLSDKTNVMTINLEEIEKDFPVFWDFISAKGNLDVALREFKTSHNASSKRQFNFFYRAKLILRKEWRHFRLYLKDIF